MHVPRKKPIHNKKRGEKTMTENNNTLGNIIQTQIENTINTQPHPTKAKVIKVYDDGRVDIETTQYGTLRYVPTITTHQTGDKTILIYLNNNFNEFMVI